MSTPGDRLAIIVSGDGGWAGIDTSLGEALNRERTPNVLCIYGADEKDDSLCPQLDPKSFRIVEMKGGHHFGGDYDRLARLILEHMK